MTFGKPITAKGAPASLASASFGFRHSSLGEWKAPLFDLWNSNLKVGRSILENIMSNIFGILEIFIKSSQIMFRRDSETKEFKMPVLIVFCSGIKLGLLWVRLRTSCFRWGCDQYICGKSSLEMNLNHLKMEDSSPKVSSLLFCFISKEEDTSVFLFLFSSFLFTYSALEL